MNSRWLTRPKNWLWWRNKPINIQQAREHLHDKLAALDTESPSPTSLILLQHALNQPKSWILAHNDFELTSAQRHILLSSVDKYLQGVPLPYILGQWDFFGRTFTITPHVLIPRPETELLVEKAIEHAQQIPHPLIADVGTGSGAIAVSLAAELPDAKIIAMDISREVLDLARKNAHLHQQTRIGFVQTDLMAPFNAKFDLICANLPYIPTKTLQSLPVADWEPRLALDGGESGLDLIQRLLMQAGSLLSPSGVIVLETEASLGQATLNAASDTFPTAQCQLIKDLAGQDRIVEIRRG